MTQLEGWWLLPCPRVPTPAVAPAPCLPYPLVEGNGTGDSSVTCTEDPSPPAFSF